MKGVVERIMVMLPLLNEKQKRLMLAAEAKALGHGGIKKIAEIACVARTTIMIGLKEIINQKIDQSEKVRKRGGGRKKKEETHPNLQPEIINCVDSSTRGHPETALLWTSKSVRKIAVELKKKGYDVSHVVVANVLKK